MNIKYSVNSDLESKLSVVKPKKPVFKKLRFSTQFLRISAESSKGFPTIPENVADELECSPQIPNREFCNSSTCKAIRRCLDSRDLKLNISQCIKKLFSDNILN